MQSKFKSGMFREDFKQVIRDAWETIEIEKIDGLIENMLTCISALKDQKGRSTRH